MIFNIEVNYFISYLSINFSTLKIIIFNNNNAINRIYAIQMINEISSTKVNCNFSYNIYIVNEKSILKIKYPNITNFFNIFYKKNILLLYIFILITYHLELFS